MQDLPQKLMNLGGCLGENDVNVLYAMHAMYI